MRISTLGTALKFLARIFERVKMIRILGHSPKLFGSSVIACKAACGAPALVAVFVLGKRLPFVR
jgi:hypothetical protein